VHAGDAEILYPDDKGWAESMRSHGNDVTFEEERGVPHDIMAVGHMMGFEGEARNSAKQAGEWLRSKV
jgi:acetyl esterase/lipase